MLATFEELWASNKRSSQRPSAHPGPLSAYSAAASTSSSSAAPDPSPSVPDSGVGPSILSRSPPSSRSAASSSHRPAPSRCPITHHLAFKQLLFSPCQPQPQPITHLLVGGLQPLGHLPGLRLLPATARVSSYQLLMRDASADIITDIDDPISWTTTRMRLKKVSKILPYPGIRSRHFYQFEGEDVIKFKSFNCHVTELMGMRSFENPVKTDVIVPFFRGERSRGCHQVYY